MVGVGRVEALHVKLTRDDAQLAQPRKQLGLRERAEEMIPDPDEREDDE